LPGHVFQKLVGVVLLYSAWRFLLRPPPESDITPPPRAAALGIGGGIGLLSGLTGTGGGIFLTPVLLFMHWARTKNAAAVSALFILVNSISALLGTVTSTGQCPSFALVLAAAAALGGTIGSRLGSRHFDPVLIKRLLAAVLSIAGGKLLLT